MWDLAPHDVSMISYVLGKIQKEFFQLLAVLLMVMILWILPILELKWKAGQLLTLRIVGLLRKACSIIGKRN